MRGDAKIVIGVVASVGAVGGLLWWGHSRAAALAAMKRDNPLGPGPTTIVMWPGLKVGTVVLVDTARALLPPELRTVPQIAATVDMVLLDRESVSVSIGAPIVGWSGTISRDAIIRILYVPPTAVVVL